jgi:alcohol dehydrogenase
MKALCFDGELALREVAAPEPAAGEALVRVRMAGICNTDVEIARG